MSILITLLTNPTFAKSLSIILFQTMICYWITIKYPKFFILKNLCWIGNVTSNFFLFLILILRWLIFGYFPLSNLYESLLFLDWCLIFIIFLIESKTKTKIISAVIIPLNLLVIVFATLILPQPMQIAESLVPSLHSNWLMMHVSMMMLSYSILLIGSLLSILFFTLNKNDLIKKLLTYQQITKIQLLENIDNWSYRIIGLGFPFLTIGIISGAIWANEAWGSYWSWDPKETWALITWIIFAAYIHARLAQGWKGEKASILGSFGFFIIWICYLGTNFLGQGLHSYGFLV
jgi:cytochrome c-type biogenesis protein CcsB